MKRLGMSPFSTAKSVKAEIHSVVVVAMAAPVGPNLRPTIKVVSKTQFKVLAVNKTPTGVLVSINPLKTPVLADIVKTAGAASARIHKKLSA